MNAARRLLGLEVASVTWLCADLLVKQWGKGGVRRRNDKQTGLKKETKKNAKG